MEREGHLFLTFFMLHASRDDGSREKRPQSKQGERNRSSSQQWGGPEKSEKERTEQRAEAQGGQGHAVLLLAPPHHLLLPPLFYTLPARPSQGPIRRAAPRTPPSHPLQIWPPDYVGVGR
jgi:hypothetical protein